MNSYLTLGAFVSKERLGNMKPDSIWDPGFSHLPSANRQAVLKLRVNVDGGTQVVGSQVYRLSPRCVNVEYRLILLDTVVYLQRWY